MRCLLQRLRLLAWVPAATAALVWGCATSGAGDLSPDTSSSLPEVDASWTPSPATSNQESADAGTRGTGSGTPGASSTEGPAEAGASKQGPLPPPPSAAKPSQGEVLITEVMYDPSANEPATEWIEVHSEVTTPRLLSGLTIVDGANRTHVIGAGVTIAPGAYVILARNTAAATAAKVPAAAIAYEYSDTIQLANGTTGGVSLRDGATTIAQAAYGGWFSQSGASIQLAISTFAASAQKAGWCLSQKTWATGSDKGTPGTASDCP